MAEQNSPVSFPDTPNYESEPHNATDTLMESPLMNFDLNQEYASEPETPKTPNGGTDDSEKQIVVWTPQGGPGDGMVGGDNDENSIATAPVLPALSDSCSVSQPKRARGRPRRSGGRSQRRASRGIDRVAFRKFAPMILNVLAGEDIVRSLLYLSQRTSRSLYIISSAGVIGSASLLAPGSANYILKYQGRFQIITLSASFMYVGGRNPHSKHGRISVILCTPDGNLFGGPVVGSLIVAETTQIFVGTFPRKEITPLKRRYSGESSTSNSSQGNSRFPRVSMPIAPPPTDSDESCISSPSVDPGFPARNEAENVIDENDNMNPDSPPDSGQNVSQPMPDQETSSEICS